MKLEYEQQGIYFECKNCPDSYLHTGKYGEFYCHHYVNDWRKIETDVNAETPDWCPRFPL